MLHSMNGGDVEPTKQSCHVGSLSYSEGIFKADLPSDLRQNDALNETFPIMHYDGNDED